METCPELHWLWLLTYYLLLILNLFTTWHGFKLLTRYLSQMSFSQGGFNCLMVEDVLFWGFLSVETTIKYFIKSKLTLQLTHAFILLSISLLNCRLKKAFWLCDFAPSSFTEIMAGQVWILTLAQLICSLTVCDGVAETINLSSELLCLKHSLIN